MFLTKSLLLLGVISLTLAESVVNKEVPIVSYENQVGLDGKYHYSYETGDGSKAQVDGDLKALDKENGIESALGSYEYVGDDGKTYSVQYTADENGFQPVGEHIPKIPDLIQKALDYLATAPPPKDGKY